MFRRLWHNSAACAAASGLAAVLAFPTLELVPFVLFTGFFLTVLALRPLPMKRAFWLGFLPTLVIMLLAFYWVVYVIHEFGHLPWSVSTLLYLGFCGFGALNFPAFTALASVARQKLGLESRSGRFVALWCALGLPALFTGLEWAIPKLFPWYLGHALYRATWLTQICEWTGSSFMTFVVFSTGALAAAIVYRRLALRDWLPAAVVPGLCWTLCLATSAYRLLEKPNEPKAFRVALIQANIGSLEKVAARKGIGGKVQYTIGRYLEMTERALSEGPKPDLILWPETAMPFSLDQPGLYTQMVRDAVKRWNVPLITGGYAVSLTDMSRDYNAAFLLEPSPDAENGLRGDIYRKNILLAFGEYFPGADYYPELYRMFPQVSNFERGLVQNPFTLRDGTKLGITICYEAIVPTFYRKVVRNGVHAVVNLTNDSWFGPTSEPYQHAALAVFRAIETRAPLLRVTNTGTSFTVDSRGRLSAMTGVYQEGWLVSQVNLPADTVDTFYVRMGDWFIVVCFGLFAVFFVRRRAPLPSRS